MNDSGSPSAPPDRWLLLVHQLPSKPAYFRVKIWRRLQALGAVSVKNAVYALPAGEQAQEDFEWLLKEINDGGGDGLIWEARLLDGMSDQDVRTLFNTARDADYQAIAAEIRALQPAQNTGQEAETRSKVTRLRAHFTAITTIDFFGADGREATEGLLGALETRLREKDTDMPKPTLKPTQDRSAPYKGRVWVTRKSVQVDRIASAWLIRRFVDPDAIFKFVPAKGYTPSPGELRFDMFEAEFTHQGDRCTFEILLAYTGLKDPGLTALSEIVHDIDLKDAKFGREEAGGVARVIEGIAAGEKDDARRLERGGVILDDLYEVLRRRRR
jgi:hypothetical protein